jgi:hypothetical protein
LREEALFEFCLAEVRVWAYDGKDKTRAVPMKPPADEMKSETSKGFSVKLALSREETQTPSGRAMTVTSPRSRQAPPSRSGIASTTTESRRNCAGLVSKVR